MPSQAAAGTPAASTGQRRMVAGSETGRLTTTAQVITCHPGIIRDRVAAMA